MGLRSPRASRREFATKAAARAQGRARRRFLRRAPAGIHYSDHLEGDGVEIFAHACRLGLEGIVSKNRARPYRSGPSKTWVKIKNLQAPGVLRFEDRDAPA
jgi:ATP-dependent DNA ligase